MKNHISVKELIQLKNPNIIDIRTLGQYQMGHIPGAILMDASELYFHPNQYLKKEEIYYIYCNSGMKSSSLVQKLIQNGYHAVNVDGGYHNYLFHK